MMVMAMLVGAWAGWLDRVTMQRLSMRRLHGCPGAQVPWCPGEQYASRRASHFKLCTLSNMPLTMLLRRKASHFKPLPAPRSIAICTAHLCALCMAKVTFCTNNLSLTELLHYLLCTVYYALCTMHRALCKLQELSEWHCRGRHLIGTKICTALSPLFSDSAPICPSLGAIACRLISY